MKTRMQEMNDEATSFFGTEDNLSVDQTSMNSMEKRNFSSSKKGRGLLPKVKTNFGLKNKLKTFSKRKSKMNKTLRLPGRAITMKKKAFHADLLPVIKEKTTGKRFKSPLVPRI